MFRQATHSNRSSHCNPIPGNSSSFEHLTEPIGRECYNEKSNDGFRPTHIGGNLPLWSNLAGNLRSVMISGLNQVRLPGWQGYRCKENCLPSHHIAFQTSKQMVCILSGSRIVRRDRMFFSFLVHCVNNRGIFIQL
jgi:hypothetical protein